MCKNMGLEGEKHSTCFVYGTLQEKSVLEALLGRLPEVQEAVLGGYRRYLVVDEVYPGARPSSDENSEVSGLLLVGLTSHEMSIIDVFEGDEYQKLPVEVGGGLLMWINQ